MAATSFLGKHGFFMFQVVFALALWFWYYMLAKDGKNTGFWPTVLLLWAILYTGGFAFTTYKKIKGGGGEKQKNNSPENSVNNFYSNNLRKEKPMNIPGRGLGYEMKQSKIVPDPNNGNSNRKKNSMN